jgi:transcription initiation factor TFIID subunit 1
MIAQIEARPKSAHRYNVAEQQQIYREEIARIWKAQLDSLGNKTEPILSDHEDEEEDRDVDQVDSPSAVSDYCYYYNTLDTQHNGMV